MEITQHPANDGTPNPDIASAPLVGRVDFSEPGAFPHHRHRKHQLSFAISGVLYLSTSVGTWILPPSRALLIKAGIEHSTEVKRPAQIRTLYIDPDAYDLPSGPECMVFEVTPLVRELIFACTKFRWDYAAGSAEHRMSQVLIDQFHKLDHTPVNIPMPHDTRALKIVEILRKDPGNRDTLAQLSESVGASARTIERIFARETPMTFGAWRQRQRLVAAVERLAYGANVHTIAHEVGYDSASSFVVAFKKMFGTTPAQYFKTATLD